MIRRATHIVRRYYHSRIIQHFENPQHVGSLGDEPNVYTGLVGSPACGDVMKLQLRIEDDHVVDAKFKTFGCGTAIAASSYAAAVVRGKHVDELESFTNASIAQHLKLPPVKLHCSMLAQDAIQSAVSKYNSSVVHPFSGAASEAVSVGDAEGTDTR